MIFAIDPGNIQSAYVEIDDNYKLFGMGKVDNHEALSILANRLGKYRSTIVVIERVASYGMSVGADVFQTCEWIGRFAQLAEGFGCKVDFIYRKEEKLNLCGNIAAKDNNVRAALVERFAQHDFKNGKGTKKNPDVFYGVTKDIWAAIAVGVTYIDKMKGMFKYG